MTESRIPGGSAPDTGGSAGSEGARPPLSWADASHPVPEPLTKRFGDDIDEVVWVNEVGGVTVRATVAGETVFAKWAPPNSELDLAAEAERLRWAGRYIRVPRVLELTPGVDGEILVTAALAGDNAVALVWRARPERAVRSLGAGLRALHDAIPVSACPFSWSVRERIARTMNDGIPERVAAVGMLGETPAIDRLVVCHADACAPNTLLDAGGGVAGYVDLGRLGVADRWADIAVGAWSTEWNYGPGLTGLYYESYGIEPDEERIAFYRALWDAT